MITAFVVMIENGDSEPELHGFHEAAQADQFAGVRGSCIDIHAVEVLDEFEAAALIAAEAKERAEDERVDRYLAEH